MFDSNNEVPLVLGARLFIFTVELRCTGSWIDFGLGSAGYETITDEMKVNRCCMQNTMGMFMNGANVV